MFTIEHFAEAIWAFNAVFFGLIALWLLGYALLFASGFVYGLSKAVIETQLLLCRLKRERLIS